MSQREVTRSGKDKDGDIKALCKPGESWSPRAKADAIRDIKSGSHTYYVSVNGSRVDVHVVKGASGEYLRTDADGRGHNNLDDLPDC